jgi:hypothetical protein
MLKTALLTAVASLALASAAQAATITYTSAPFTSSGATFTPAVQQFDPSLGTLTGASITLHMNLTPKVSLFNISGSPASYSYAFSNTVLSGATPVTWTDPYGSSALDNYNLVFGVLGGPTIGVAPVGPSSIPGSPIPETSSSTVPGVNLPTYIGLGTVGVTYNVTGSTNSGGQGVSGLFFGGDRSFAGTADVTYTYTAAPEPASLAIIGLAGMALLARRRRV